VAPPEESRPWGGPARRDDAGEHAAVFGTPPAVGHHLVSEHREAHIMDTSADRPGHMALWARLTGEFAGTTMTPAVLGFLADMVPIAVCRAGGVEGAGTSLDNSLRVGEPIDTDWVLLELDAEQAVGGYGHGHVRLWSRDGRLLGTGTQSCRLFSFEDFLHGAGGHSSGSPRAGGTR
jgi:acyl-CoA thioesterase